MKKKILAYIFDGYFSNHKYVHGNLISSISKEFSRVIFIDLTFLKLNINLNNQVQNKNLFIPKSYNELDLFLSKNEVISFVSLGTGYEYFKILRLLKKRNVKLIQNMSIGYNKQNEIFEIKKKIQQKLQFFIFRFLVFINYFPKIELIFEGSKENISKMNKQLGRKIDRIFPFLNFAYIKKIEHINCRAYDTYLSNLKDLSEKYIVFLDGGFDHPDVQLYEKKQNSTNRKIYYSYLKKILNKLSKIYDKKVIFCAHPKVNEKKIKTFFKDAKIKIVQYKTQYYILRAFMVVMHESSTTFDAIILKKRILNLNSILMGNYYYNRNKFYPKRIKIPSFEMENYKEIRRVDIDKYFENKESLYDNYLKNFVKDVKSYKLIYFDKLKKSKYTQFNNLPGTTQMIKIIKKKFF